MDRTLPGSGTTQDLVRTHARARSRRQGQRGQLRVVEGTRDSVRAGDVWQCMGTARGVVVRLQTRPLVHRRMIANNEKQNKACAALI